MIPSIRTDRLDAAVEFYVDRLGFAVVRGTPAEANVALSRGGERVMLEAPGDFYSAGYNEAIGARVGSPSPHSLYIEEPELEDYYAAVQEKGVEIVDALAPRPWGQVEFTLADGDGNWLTFWRLS